MSDVRSRETSPILEDFRAPGGTPVVVRNGSTDIVKAYALRRDNVIVDLFTGLEQDTGGWDDLRFPAQAINPGGAAAAPSVDTDLTGYPGTFLFSALLDNYVTGVAQMPHGWRAESTVKPHIHWSKTTADGGGAAVDWEFQYRLGNPDETASALSGWIPGTLVVGDLTTQELHNITSFGDVDMTGIGVSGMMFWQVRRLGATDAYGDLARLIEFDIHYQVVAAGTATPAPDHG